MTPPNNLETGGSLRTNPLAELLLEIALHNFNGSLRLSNTEQKAVVYFDAGAPIFAASNARRHRLFEMLLQAEKITKDELTGIENFTNDLALKDYLLKNDLLDAAEVNGFFARQLSEILRAAIDWNAGEWTFSPLVRARGDFRFSVDVADLLIEFARNVSSEEAARRFKNPLEIFEVNAQMPANVNLTPTESFVFSRFERAMSAREILTVSGLPEAQTFQTLYALWLGGFLSRPMWSAAFSEKTVAAMQSAKLSVKKAEAKPVVQTPTIKTDADAAPDTETKAEGAVEEIAPPEKETTLDEYLERVEKSKTLYETFALSPDAPVADIKRVYFSLAKRFHPDLFHKEADAKLMQRIQNAFSEIARAYETLKDEAARGVYDFRMRKELAEAAEREASGITEEQVDVQKQIDQAALNFEQGFNLVMEENYEAAVSFLARAVHFAPEVARYHAYHGKALAATRKPHQAEAEMRAAIKLDDKNADYRIMLAEFFISVRLIKRAEGELTRMLAIFPNHREAQTLLDGLKGK